MVLEGSRVIIVGRKHPWYGETGEVIESAPANRSDWVVELDDGRRRCGVDNDELRRIEDL
jgi:hypothetical protein